MNGDDSQPPRILAELALRVGGDIVTAGLQDGTVGELRPDGRVKVAIFRHRLRKAALAYPFEAYSSDTFLQLRVKGNFRHGGFSVNRADRVMLTKPTEHKLGSRQLPVFTGMFTEPTPFLEDSRLVDLIDVMVRHPLDSFHHFSNSIGCYVFAPDDIDALSGTVELLIELAEHLDQGPEPEIALPEGFENLQPFVGRFGMGDDAERQDAIVDASSDELRSLIDAVEPRIKEINRVLAEANNADEYFPLGTLVDASHGASWELSRRADQPPRCG